MTEHNVEKELRARVERYRRALVTARNLLLKYEHAAVKPDYPIAALRALSKALEG